MTLHSLPQYSTAVHYFSLAGEMYICGRVGAHGRFIQPEGRIPHVFQAPTCYEQTLCALTGAAEDLYRRLWLRVWFVRLLTLRKPTPPSAPAAIAVKPEVRIAAVADGKENVVKVSNAKLTKAQRRDLQELADHPEWFIWFSGRKAYYHKPAWTFWDKRVGTFGSLRVKGLIVETNTITHESEMGMVFTISDAGRAALGDTPAKPASRTQAPGHYYPLTTENPEALFAAQYGVAPNCREIRPSLNKLWLGYDPAKAATK